MNCQGGCHLCKIGQLEGWRAMTEERDEPSSMTKGDPEQATIRLLFLTALVNVLQAADRRIEPLLRDHGFFLSQIATPYERAPLHRYIALIEHAADKYDEPYLGLEMGARSHDLMTKWSQRDLAGGLVEYLDSFHPSRTQPAGTSNS